jgi:hypothetical protein
MTYSVSRWEAPDPEAVRLEAALSEWIGRLPRDRVRIERQDTPDEHVFDFVPTAQDACAVAVRLGPDGGFGVYCTGDFKFEEVSAADFDPLECLESIRQGRCAVNEYRWGWLKVGIQFTVRLADGALYDGFGFQGLLRGRVSVRTRQFAPW